MEARHRLARVAVGRIWLAAAGAVLLIALTLCVLVTLSSLPRTTHPSTLVNPTIVTSPEERAK
jgi:hypothetical protein